MADSATTFAARYDRTLRSGVRCPDCNEQLVSERAINVHKAMGGCVPVPGARARLAAYLADCLSRKATV